MSRAALVVFGKEPRPGFVKTRMCPPLEPEQASALYACMLEDVLDESRKACARAGAALYLAVHPPRAVRSMARVVRPPVRTIAQHGPDLASRMHDALAQLAAAGFERLAVRGSDSPALPAARIEEAFEALDDADLSVSRDADGGYALLALREPHRGLFDHPMSTDSVADATVANARRLGWRCHELAPGFDLDTVEDLSRLRALPRELAAARCPRTVGLLDEQGWWPG